jgi:hypothetical protein
VRSLAEGIGGNDSGGRRVDTNSLGGIDGCKDVALPPALARSSAESAHLVHCFADSYAVTSWRGRERVGKFAAVSERPREVGLEKVGKLVVRNPLLVFLELLSLALQKKKLINEEDRARRSAIF